MIINLVTLNTPSREYQLDENSSINHFNIYNPFDIVQVVAGVDFEASSDPGGYGTAEGRGFAGRKFSSAINISYKDQLSNDSGAGLSGHAGTADQNFSQWLPKLEKAVNKLNSFKKQLRNMRFRQQSKEQHQRNFEEQKKKAFSFR